MFKQDIHYNQYMKEQYNQTLKVTCFAGGMQPPACQPSIQTAHTGPYVRGVTGTCDVYSLKTKTIYYQSNISNILS